VRAAEAVVRAAVPLDGDAVLARARDARFVLLGEASHGTHEHYRERAALTKRLLDELGFDAVAAEADWPDAYRVNCFVRGAGDDATAAEALGDFRRFPAWMWRNRDVVELVAWLASATTRARPGRAPASTASTSTASRGRSTR
jgi:erythromycin esterase-like protein